ncbi:TIR domain-containing protein [Luteibacter aegosomatis]|uniref:TIR domain-containing protein n=1 Tax=Luteibacter aegosomatis TaxID=2911537 RepID=UPI001FF80959|nr:TIR domain-containing protein [Luteibacter aegosomatis]UPG87589.1 TIR domain-containing protein [Luteibacter aegosomatis]
MSTYDVFYSFHFQPDVFRVQQIRNMGVITGDEPVKANEWETIKATPSGVEKWIDANMKGKDAVVVLIGAETASRPWVKYEIKRAWETGKAVLGIYIHNLKNIDGKTTNVGNNPFSAFTFKLADGTVVVPHVFDPKASDAYNDIEANIQDWIAKARRQRGLKA